MLELELLVRLLHPTQLLELGQYLLIYRRPFCHDHSLACLFAPTRQHEGMDVKRLGHVLYGNAGHLAQTDRGGLELAAVARGGARARLGHGDDS